MSTRGAVGFPLKQGWKGRYNHYDSYPSGLAKDLWTLVQKAGIELVLSAITSKTAARKLKEDFGYLGEWVAEEGWLTHKSSNTLFTKWVYLLENAGLTILSSYATDKMKQTDVKMSFPIYEHAIVGFYAWTDPEPSWEDVGGNFESLSPAKKEKRNFNKLQLDLTLPTLAKRFLKEKDPALKNYFANQLAKSPQIAQVANDLKINFLKLHNDQNVLLKLVSQKIAANDRTASSRQLT